MEQCYPLCNTIVLFYQKKKLTLFLRLLFTFIQQKCSTFFFEIKLTTRDAALRSTQPMLNNVKMKLNKKTNLFLNEFFLHSKCCLLLVARSVLCCLSFAECWFPQCFLLYVQNDKRRRFERHWTRISIGIY